jgi:hypothetical protein
MMIANNYFPDTHIPRIYSESKKFNLQSGNPEETPNRRTFLQREGSPESRGTHLKGKQRLSIVDLQDSSYVGRRPSNTELYGDVNPSLKTALLLNPLGGGLTKVSRPTTAIARNGARLIPVESTKPTDLSF